MCTGQVGTDQRHLHYPCIAAAWATAFASHSTRDYMETSLSRWPKLTSWSTNRRGKGRGLIKAKENKPLFGLAVFFCCLCKNLFWQFFSKLISLSVGEGLECVCRLQWRKSPAACSTILHVFSSFLQSVNETIRKFQSCRQLKKWLLLLLRKGSKL